MLLQERLLPEDRPDIARIELIRRARDDGFSLFVQVGKLGGKAELVKRVPYVVLDVDDLADGMVELVVALMHGTSVDVKRACSAMRHPLSDPY